MMISWTTAEGIEVLGSSQHPHHQQGYFAVACIAGA
jgi:hypothetical protein